MPLPFSHYCVVDFETYYDSEYSLRNKSLSMTDYIRHELFEAISVAVWHSTWDVPKVAAGPDVGPLLRSINWNETAFCAHHAQFDGLILTHHYDLHPVFWLDTQSMSRMLFGVDVSHSLDAVSQRYGFAGKVKAQALEQVKGLRYKDIPKDLLQLLLEYNEDDARLTRGIFEKMVKHVPEDELRIIDLTMRMYCEPVLHLDEARLREVHGREVGRRAAAVQAAGVDLTVLGSAQKFADYLRSLGVEPPVKISPRTGQPTYAFAKTDLEFKALLRHPDPRVVAAVEARLTAKSTLIETRSQRLLRRVGLPTPMYYNYWGARTGRWSGGDSVNWQNMARRGEGAALRTALAAPEGCNLVIADASQIEARLVAWLADDQELLTAFAEGEDVYSVNASGVYGFPVNKDDHPDERFVGKVLSLSCQYGAGGVKVSNVFRLGNLGPAIDMSVAEAKELVAKWRQARWPITRLWTRLGEAAKLSWLSGQQIELGPVGFDYLNGNGYIHLPNGTYMKYPRVYVDADNGELHYVSKNGPVKVWGGYLLENIAQALSCVLLKQQMLRCIDTIPHDVVVASTTHDEMVLVTYEETAEEVAAAVKRIMSTPEEWSQGLPLNASVDVSAVYDKV